ncbi:MAG TPA: M48 family metallopeptidase [Acidimicrobiales bacterium]|nr:M48 family metallopeptidase [Acidimicrobiales bacterium]
MTAALSPYRRVPADPSELFDAAEIEESRRYNRPQERLRLVRYVLTTAVMLAFVFGDGAPRLLDALDVKGWALQVVVVLGAILVLDLGIATWFDAHKDLVWDRQWGISTQSVRGFVVDVVKNLLLSLVLTAALLVPLWAIVRWTDAWWLLGWLVFAGINVGIGVLYPVLIAPLFNTFTPMADESLRGRLLGVAERCGLDVREVLVADASKRSRGGNAYVAGMGRTRRVVVFDTILDWPEATIANVTAHELGHWKHKHIRRRVPLILGVLLVQMILTYLVLQWDWLLESAGVEELGDPAALPLFFLVFPLGAMLTTLVSSWLSRADERAADIYALETMRDPDAFEDTFRRLADTNKADVDPPLWKRVTASHPPIPERLAMGRRWKADQAPSSS